MQIHNFEQGTQEWLDSRKGKMTASHAQAIGNCGKGLETYIIELMAEYYSTADKEHYNNNHTERGIELEPIARSIYEFEKQITVEQIGFVELDEYTGASPDGLIGVDGLLEIKCVNDVSYLKHLLNGIDEVDTKYLWQVQMQLYVTGRQWVDLLIYNPNFKQNMSVYKIKRDEDKIEKLKQGLEIGKNLINNIKQKML